MKSVHYSGVQKPLVSWTGDGTGQNLLKNRPEIPTTNSYASQNPSVGSGTILSVRFGTDSAMTPLRNPRGSASRVFSRPRRAVFRLSKAPDFRAKNAVSYIIIYEHRSKLAVS